MSDDYERSLVLQSLVKKTLASNCSLQRFSSDLECRELFDALQSPSLFGGDAVVLFDECETLKKSQVEQISGFLEKTAPCGYLLMGSRGKTPLSKVVEKTGIILDMSEEKPWDKEKRLIETLAAIATSQGKRLASDATPLLLERLGTDISLLTQEVNKLICYVGDRLMIERSDIFRISSTGGSHTLWQIAEEIIWEGGGSFDPSMFPGIIFSLRPQLQIGLKITTLIEEGVPFSEWTPYFPKMWPRTLEKRREQAAQKGSAFFRKGLKMLFKIESLSRTGSNQAEALFDLFRTTLSNRPLA
jgi:DNA polymerase-3 subunit delta